MKYYLYTHARARIHPHPPSNFLTLVLSISTLYLSPTLSLSLSLSLTHIGGKPYHSDVALSCRSTGRTINPAPGAWFISIFISLSRISPSQCILRLQNPGLRHHSFHSIHNSGLYNIVLIRNHFVYVFFLFNVYLGLICSIHIMLYHYMFQLFRA